MTTAERRALFAGVFGSPEGRSALREILDYCGAGHCVFHAESARLTDFNLGRQAVAVWLAHELNPKHKENAQDGGRNAE